MTEKLGPMRAPAVPLIVHDPYFSYWSFNDKLTDHWYHHWTGSFAGMAGICRIDGKAYTFSGEPQAAPAMEQLAVEILPTRTIYRFAADGVELELTFLTPALLHKLEVLSRPITYLVFQVKSIDGKAHDAEVYFDMGGEPCVNCNGDDIVWSRLRHEKLELMCFGSATQAPLTHSGDDLRIDWGHCFLALPKQFNGRTGISPNHAMRQNFATTGAMPSSDYINMPEKVRQSWVAQAATLELPVAPGETNRAFLIVGYDDVWSIEYLGRKLPGYWRLFTPDFGQLLTKAVDEFAQLENECRSYDAEIMRDAERVGGEKYARLCALSFRQGIGAHKLVADLDGTPLFFSKENFSNGCIATVDVTYPSAPLFLLMQPVLLKGMLIPILQYAETYRWKFPFAPHDLGTYPLANGQVYGGGERTEENQMPVEECGNMLLLAGALVEFTNDLPFVEQHWATWSTWANYLLEKGYDPENQLCTDDFAGHLAHNTNLSLKAILAMGAYAKMAQKLGHDAEAQTFMAAAQDAADRWSVDALEGDHYKLAFDQTGTWSQKYNLVWDRLLNLNLFSTEIAERELAYYRTKQERFGLPLDSRRTYTKLDWIIWSATLTGKADDFTALLDPVYRWINETTSRVPLTDWYETTDGKQVGFQARSVVCGVFIKMMADEALRTKYLAK